MSTVYLAPPLAPDARKQRRGDIVSRAARNSVNSRGERASLAGSRDNELRRDRKLAAREDPTSCGGGGPTSR